MKNKTINRIKTITFKNIWMNICSIVGVISGAIGIWSYFGMGVENGLGVVVGNNFGSTIYDLKDDKHIALIFQICSEHKTSRKIAPFCISLCNIIDKPLDEYEYSIQAEHIMLSDAIAIPAIFDDGNTFFSGCNFKIDEKSEYLVITYKKNEILYPSKYDYNFKYWNVVTDLPIEENGELMRAHAILNVRNHDWYKELDINAYFFEQDSDNKIFAFAEKYNKRYDKMFIITLGHEKIIIPKDPESKNEYDPIEVLKVIEIKELKK